MRRSALLASLALAAAASACGPTPPIHEDYAPFVASYLRQANENWFSGLRDKSPTLLEPLLSDDVTINWPDGTTATKASLLDDLRSGRVRYDSVTGEQSRTRIVGTSAIVTGQATLQSQRDGQPVVDRIVYTALYAWTGQAWKMLAWQGTRRQ